MVGEKLPPPVENIKVLTRSKKGYDFVQSRSMLQIHVANKSSEFLHLKSINWMINSWTQVNLQYSTTNGIFKINSSFKLWCLSNVENL